jgi:hypothetical protein
MQRRREVRLDEQSRWPVQRGHDDLLAFDGATSVSAGLTEAKGRTAMRVVMEKRIL